MPSRRLRRRSRSRQPISPEGGYRLSVSRAVAIESPRGWRITKEKQSHRIDVVVALAMACHAAVTMGAVERRALAVGVESFGSRGSGGGIVRGDKYLTADQVRAERPPPPPDHLDYVWNEQESRWARPWIDPRSR
jgi:hypothetical protein